MGLHGNGGGCGIDGIEAWPERPPPDGRLVRRWTPSSVAELPGIRDELRGVVGQDSEQPRDTVEVLVLLFDELLSNGLRHGYPPVVAELRATEQEWVLEVSDQAAEVAPEPDLERDRAQGGMGLLLIAGLASAYGWFGRGSRKSVWGATGIA